MSVSAKTLSLAVLLGTGVFFLGLTVMTSFLNLLPQGVATEHLSQGIGTAGTQIQAVLPQPSATPSLREQARIVRVVDGDTVELEGGKILRYIGIDTPETKHPGKQVECYGQEAYKKNVSLVGGRMVELEKDLSEVDRYGRLLRYVYVDGSMVNEVLVRDGFAQAVSFPPDVVYQEKLRSAEQKARQAKLGLWGTQCADAPEESQQAVEEEQVSPPVLGTYQNADCLYSCLHPDKDCSDFVTQAQAQVFFLCCGFSATNDPMRIDGANGVGNGQACESLR